MTGEDKTICLKKFVNWDLSVMAFMTYRYIEAGPSSATEVCVDVSGSISELG